MARPKKTGLDYYYKSVHDMDDFRVMDLMEKYGTAGYVVLDMTMSCVYRNGYYLELPVKRLASYIYRYIAGSCAIGSEGVAEIIRYCGELGLFDSELMSLSVITSREIQEHYASVAARRKADKSKYWLLPEESDAACEDGEKTEENEKNDSAEQTVVYAAKTPVYAAETRVSDYFGGMNETIIPQSKSKVNQSKENQSKANESKAKQSSRVSADEIFFFTEDTVTDTGTFTAAAAEDAFAYTDTYTDIFTDTDTYTVTDTSAAAAAGKDGFEYEERFTDGYSDSYGDGFTVTDTRCDASYGEIEKTYLAVAGKKMKESDREYIKTLRGEGADDRLMIEAMNKVASREKKRNINSFRYFMPMIRDMLCESGKKPGSAPPEQVLSDDGFIHGDAVYEDPYAGCTTTEEYIAVLDREIKCPSRW